MQVHPQVECSGYFPLKLVFSMITKDLLSDLLIEWEMSLENGQEKTPEELAGSNQNLVEELRKRIKALKATEWMDRSESLGVSEKIEQDFFNQTINDRYLIEGFLGSGGHASVWAALDLKLARRVAVKIPHNASTSGKLQAEGRRIALLKHQNILPVFDFGNWGELTFIVTELVTGVSLEKILAKSKLSAFRAYQIIQDVAGALDHAHAYQIVHLDVKPSNILVDQDGTARLCDFGVAVSSAAPTHTLTGTLQYMAPEQVSGQKVSPRTDIYSLGVLVHLLFTGELPYRARHPVEFKDAIASGSVCLAGDLSPNIRRVCQKALALDPALRYEKASQLAEDLTPKKTNHFKGPLMLMVLLMGPMWLAFNNSGPNLPTLNEDWLSHVHSTEAADQIRLVQEELVRRNTKLANPGKAIIKDGVVVEYELSTDSVSDISPIRAFQKLEKLTVAGTRTAKANGRLSDLKPLSGMGIKWLSVTYNRQLQDLGPLADLPLEFLNCGECDVSDLSPLRTCPLKVLVCGFNPISDLSPLKGLSLEELHCNTTKVRDLGPVAGMPLREVRCQDSQVDNLEPLRGAPVGLLECHRTNITNIAPLAGNASIWGLNIYATKVHDKSPLATLPKLRLLALSYDPKVDHDILVQMPWLEEVNNQPVKAFLKKNEAGPALLR